MEWRLRLLPCLAMFSDAATRAASPNTQADLGKQRKPCRSSTYQRLPRAAQATLRGTERPRSVTAPPDHHQCNLLLWG